MVPREPVSERICFLTTYIVQHLIRERSWEWIMHTIVIQFFEIHTYTYLILLLPLLHHHWTYPLRFFHRLNDAFYEHFV